MPDQILERITFSGPCMGQLFLLWAWYQTIFLYKLSCFLLWALQIESKCKHANSWPQAVIHLCFFLAFVSFIVPLVFVSAFAFLLGKDRWCRWLTHSDTFLFVCLFVSLFVSFLRSLHLYFLLGKPRWCRWLTHPPATLQPRAVPLFKSSIQIEILDLRRETFEI